MYSYYNISGRTIKALCYEISLATALLLFKNLNANYPILMDFDCVQGIYVYIYSIKLTKNPQSGQKCGCTFS